MHLRHRPELPEDKGGKPQALMRLSILGLAGVAVATHLLMALFAALGITEMPSLPIPNWSAPEPEVQTVLPAPPGCTAMPNGVLFCDTPLNAEGETE